MNYTYSVTEFEMQKRFYNYGFITSSDWEKYKENYLKFCKHNKTINQ